jgi:hypothetical protein
VNGGKIKVGDIVWIATGGGKFFDVVVSEIVPRGWRGADSYMLKRDHNFEDGKGYYESFHRNRYRVYVTREEAVAVALMKDPFDPYS